MRLEEYVKRKDASTSLTPDYPIDFTFCIPHTAKRKEVICVKKLVIRDVETLKTTAVAVYCTCSC